MRACGLVILFVSGVLTGTLERRQLQPDNCRRHCPNILHQPVCGSDGQTYSSLCEFTVSACYYHEKHMNLRIQSYGPCDGNQFSHVDDSACNQLCDEEVHPLCGSDGIVYDNMCLFKRAECEAAKNNTRLSVLTMGDSCPTPKVPDCQQYEVDTSDIAVEGGQVIKPICHSTAQFVCASDGHTYGNECQLCHYMDLKQMNLTISYNGTCHHSSGLSGFLDPSNPLFNLLTGGEDPLAG